MSDESITGLLLRAHAQVAAQAHGEEFIHNNISAKCFYENALQSIHSAIQSVAMAQAYVYGDKKPRE
jgi:hypothetical protein